MHDLQWYAKRIFTPLIMKKVKQFLQWILDGFYWLKGTADNKKGGGDSKKLSGFAAVAVCCWVTRKWTLWAIANKDFSLLPYVLGAWFAFGAAALAINGLEKVKNVADGTEGPGKSTE